MRQIRLSGSLGDIHSSFETFSCPCGFYRTAAALRPSDLPNRPPGRQAAHVGLLQSSGPVARRTMRSSWRRRLRASSSRRPPFCRPAVDARPPVFKTNARTPPGEFPAASGRECRDRLEWSGVRSSTGKPRNSANERLSLLRRGDAPLLRRDALRSSRSESCGSNRPAGSTRGPSSWHSAGHKAPSSQASEGIRQKFVQLFVEWVSWRLWAIPSWRPSKRGLLFRFPFAECHRRVRPCGEWARFAETITATVKRIFSTGC